MSSLLPSKHGSTFLVTARGFSWPAFPPPPGLKAGPPVQLSPGFLGFCPQSSHAPLMGTMQNLSGSPSCNSQGMLILSLWRTRLSSDSEESWCLFILASTTVVPLLQEACSGPLPSANDSLLCPPPQKLLLLFLSHQVCDWSVQVDPPSQMLLASVATPVPPSHLPSSCLGTSLKKHWLQRVSDKINAWPLTRHVPHVIWLTWDCIVKADRLSMIVPISQKLIVNDTD